MSYGVPIWYRNKRKLHVERGNGEWGKGREGKWKGERGMGKGEMGIGKGEWGKGREGEWKGKWRNENRCLQIRIIHSWATQYQCENQKQCRIKGERGMGKGEGESENKMYGSRTDPSKKHIHRQEKIPSSGTLTNNTYMLWQSVTPTGSYVLSTSIDRSIPLSAVPSLGGGKVKIQFPFPLYPFPFHLSSP